MRYQFTYRNTALELWQLSMYYMYGSIVGVCNIIFTAAVVSLTAAKWNTFLPSLRFLLLLGCFLFPVIQPLLVYWQARKRASAVKQDTWIGFDDKGVYIKVGSQTMDMKWEKIKRISKKPNMIILFSDTTHGYILTNRVLGKDRKAFYQFAASKIRG